MSAEPAAHLEIRGLDKDYAAGPQPVPALRDVNVTARRGEFVSIVGPSGCGKSTLLKIILGVIAPTRGTIRIDGAEPRDARKVGMVFQVPALPPWRKVLANVLLPIDALGLPRREHLGRARELLDMVGLAEFADRYPRELSGGMQQRVALCRALIHEPELLLMDEPFGALDAITREDMQSELLRIWRRTGKTVLFVTHGIDEAVFLSSRVLLMSERPGTIVGEIAVDLPERERLDGDLRNLPRFREYSHALRERLARRGTTAQAARA
jgi:NitT/TauT family transport system ATP-binding protein